jgi:hypothetical protein
MPHLRTLGARCSTYGAQRAQPVATRGNRFGAHGKEGVDRPWSAGDTVDEMPEDHR